MKESKEIATKELKEVSPLFIAFISAIAWEWRHPSVTGEITALLLLLAIPVLIRLARIERILEELQSKASNPEAN